MMRYEDLAAARPGQVVRGLLEIGDVDRVRLSVIAIRGKRTGPKR